jgi:hypothetical protein
LEVVGKAYYVQGTKLDEKNINATETLQIPQSHSFSRLSISNFSAISKNKQHKEVVNSASVLDNQSIQLNGIKAHILRAML